MSAHPWPSEPPPAPPFTDRPLRPQDPSAMPAPAPPRPTPYPVPGSWVGGAAPPGAGARRPAGSSPAPGAPPMGDPFRPAADPLGIPDGRNRTVWLATVAGVLVVALVAAVFTLARPTTSPVAAPASSTTPTTRTPRASTTVPDPSLPFDPSNPFPDPFANQPPATDEEIRDAVAELSVFVEEKRGLTFVREVGVEVLSQAELRERLLADFDEEVADLEADGRLYRALGLVDPSYDLVEETKAVLDEEILGYYDTETEELVVRGEHISPLWRLIAVHELTHAIDHQNLDLDRPELGADGDGTDWPFLALGEGSAQWVEAAYRDTLSEDDQLLLLQETAALAADQFAQMDDNSAVLDIIASAPYELGEAFVTALADGPGGTEAIDDAYADPPSTAEQVLHAERYAAREPALEVGPPPAGGEVLHTGVLGEFLTGVLLAQGQGTQADPDGLLDDFLSGNVNPDELDPEDLLGLLAPSAASIETPSGWGGDRYVVWEQGGKACVRVAWRFDTTDDHARFADDLERWADAVAVVEVDDAEVRLIRCA